MDTTNPNIAQRLADAMTDHPQALADLEFFAADAAFPSTPAGQAAFARQILGALAPHIGDSDIRHLATALGAWAETPEDLDRIAHIGARFVQLGEQALVGLMIDALTPTPRWNGLDGLPHALNTAGAWALVLVVAALPRVVEVAR